MLTFFAFVILISSIFALFYFRFKYWLPISAFILLLTSFMLPKTLVIIFWVIEIILAVFILIAPLRMRLVTRPFIRWFRQQQPPISATEREVLEAGDTWFEKQFFAGAPNWQQLFNLPVARLTIEEQKFVDQQTEMLCQMINDWQIQQDQDLPEDVWNYIKKEGFWGLVIEKKYGGHGFSAVAHSTIVSKIASRSAAVAVTVMVPNSLGPAEFITHYGTDVQKQYYLPRLACGEEIGCFALTGPTAGSDATSVPDVGVVCRGVFQGKEQLGISLNWNKRYITLAPIATLMVIAFKLHDPEHLLGQQEDIGITLAIIPADVAGVEKGERHRPMNLAFLNGPVRGKNVFVPLDFIIGGAEYRGHGWRMMMECLSLGRGISLPGFATGMSKLSCGMSGAYAQIRHQFKRSIGDFEGISQFLGEMGGFTYLCEAARIFTAQAVDMGARPSIASAITKYQLTEIARKVVNHAMDIHAGRGIQCGPHNYLSNLYQALPIGITVEGANILTRNLIIFGQGVMRCHPYLHDELMASENDEKAFDKLWLSHIGFSLQNMAQVLVHGLTGGHLIRIGVTTRSAKYLRQLTRMSFALSFVSDVALLVVGGELKIKESLSARLGDVLSYLYLATSVIKLFHDEGETDADWPAVVWCLEYCLSQIQQAFDEFMLNFPKRFLGRLLRWMIFPWGRVYFPSSDQHTQTIAAMMQRNSGLRERLLKYCYQDRDKKSAAGQMEAAFQAWQQIKPLWKKLYKLSIDASSGQNISLVGRIESAYQAKQLTADEYKQLSEFAALYWNVLQVDEFIIREGKIYERNNADLYN